MKCILRSLYRKSVAVYLIAALLAASTFAGPAEAMFVPALPLQDAGLAVNMPGDRAADLDSIQTALESKMVRQKLLDYGLSPQEAMARVKGLSDSQIHELAAHMNTVQAGGDPADAFFGIIIVAMLVVVLIFLLQHRIEVR